MSLQVHTVDAEEARAALKPEAVKAVLRDAFAGLGTSASVQPAQTITEFPNGEGDCIFYPGLLWDLDLVGVKVSPFISALSKQGKSPVTAFTLLLSASTGEPVLLCDSLALTTARTAATTALALEYLTPATAGRLAVIGSGPVAREHLRHVVPSRQWSSVVVYSPTLADSVSDQGQARRAEVTALGLDVQFASSVQDAVNDADVIMLCTSSSTPVLNLDDVKHNATVTSVSTSGSRAHEIDPAQLTNLKVFCDYRATAPVTAGEMIIAQEQGWSPSEIIADLSELVQSSSVSIPDGRRFFRSTGLGIEDLAIASLLR